MKKVLRRPLFLFWALACCVLLGRTAVRLFALHETRAALAKASMSLAADKAEEADLEKAVRAQTEDAVFFSSLLDLYPENKSYMRTQKVIADEVEALRRETRGRLDGKLHIAVDTRANKLYFKKGLRLLWEADCSVGKGGTIKDRKTGRSWQFATPRGEFRVLAKIDSPAWIKPDWAFVENKEPVPPPDDPSRKVEGELGKYALDIGDGYLIHGTKNEASLGGPVSHGCIRLGAEALEKLYRAAPVGTRVYIY
ncbi:MAG: L,D-transpeptidase [Elusimicrobiales bacterium]|jgi:L,D-transpeptidase YbiS